MKPTYLLASLLALTLAACSHRSADPDALGAGGDTLAAEQFEAATIEPIVSPAPPSKGGTGTTTISANVFLPERKAGETFPLILHSHGWGGSKMSAADDEITGTAFFERIDSISGALRKRGYVVVSFDERGWGNSEGQIRSMDPEFETRDAIAVVDWVVKQAQAGKLPVTLENGNDPVMGSIGLSYGGGFQLLLAALDPRVDAIVPNGTWSQLLYSLLPGDAIKSSFGQLLCALADTRSPQQKDPLLVEACTLAREPQIRTRDDAYAAASDPDALIAFYYTHSLGFFKDEQAAGRFSMRPVDALLIQGTRDVLFNLNEAWDNYKFLSAAGGDVRLLSNQGGHMNPVANQTEGSDYCGAVRATDAITTWFDVKLKKQPAAALDAIPEVCLTLSETEAVLAQSVPVGVQTTGLGSGNFDVSVAASDVFVPIATIAGDGYVLAGVPRVSGLKVSVNANDTPTPIAYVSVAIRRAGSTQVVDDQVTGYVLGDYAQTFLPGIGERLQTGDEVGLLFKPFDVQFQDLGQTRDRSNTFKASGTVELPIFIPAPGQLSVRPS